MSMIELDDQAQIEDNTPKRLDIFRSRLGKSINLDYFLYSCFEQEKTRKSLLNSESPYISDLMRNISAEDKTDFASGLNEIITAYMTNFPILTSSQMLDVAALPEFIPACVNLMSEIFDFTKINQGIDELPLRSLTGSDDTGIWTAIDSAIKTNLPNQALLIIRYFQWRFLHTEPTILDLTSVPPVGIYTRMHLKARDKAEYQQRNEQRSQHRGGSVVSKKREFDRPDQGKRFDKDKDKFKDKEKFKDKDRDRNRDKNKDRPRRNSANPELDAKNSERTNEALADVKEAMAKLQSDSSQVEIILRPQNSFLRRIQHQYISDNGFKSESTGEGKDRAIKILRT